MKKLFRAVILAVIFFSSINVVKAAELSQIEEPDVWIFRKGGGVPAFSSPFTHYSIDGKTTYCIEPGTHISTDDYIGNVGLTSSPYTEEINERMELIGYYGYDYPGHQTLKYKMATQALIWETVGSQVVEYWTKPSGAGNIIRVTKERKEILNLVNNHYVVPSFNNEHKEALIGNQIIFSDTNNILSEFEIVDNKDIAYINGNELIINAKSIGEKIITLKKKTYNNDASTLFVGSDEISQKMGYFGLTHQVYAKVTIKVLGGKVTLEKLDYDNKNKISQGDGQLKGAIYGVFKENGTKLFDLEIGDNMEVTSDYFQELGKYYIKELSPSLGYTLDDNKYYFEITKDNLNPKVTVFEKVIKRKVEFLKVLNIQKTGILTPEANIQFDFYLKSNMTKIISATTNEEGYLTATLPYGTYIVRQVNSTSGFEKVKDFELIINENAKDTLTKVISDGKKEAKLKLIKIDKETKKLIKEDNIRFKIKNLDTNEYVCQNISYPHPEKICEFKTKDGMFTTPFTLDYGNYQIEEVENQNIPGYLWNSIPLKFSLNEDSDLLYNENNELVLEIYFENTPVKGRIEIQKMGEKMVLKNDTYYYKDILLDNVIYALYANEDITTSDGTLIYKKDTLIGEYKTIDGKIIIDDLYLGKYYLIEIETISNHILDKEKHYIELKYQDEQTPIVTINLNFKNYLKKQKLIINKKDQDTLELIPNTKIQIYNIQDNNENILIYEGYTNEKGQIILNDIFTGKFFLIETIANDEYLLNDNKIYFEITDKDTNIIDIYNQKIPEKIEFDVPKTSTYSNIIMYFIILIISFISINLFTKHENI